MLEDRGAQVSRNLNASGHEFRRMSVTQVLGEDNDTLSVPGSKSEDLQIMSHRTRGHPSIRTKSKTGKLKKKEALFSFQSEQ